MNAAILAKSARLCRERNVIIPTFAQLKNPDTIPDNIKQRLKQVALWDVDPVNLFRITWKNEPVRSGGFFNRGNWIEFPSALTGVRARIVGIVGKHFPTGAHKVGAAFGCLVPRLVSGQFDPTTQKAVWPSTGNYCRGGAYDCALLGCTAVAILPEQMSRERFEWLKSIGAEVIATPGCESNVKEIYDKCWEIKKTRPDCVIFNQFEEFGNAAWHYHLTGGIIEEIFEQLQNANSPGRKPGGLEAAQPRPPTRFERNQRSAVSGQPNQNTGHWAPGTGHSSSLGTSLRLAAYVTATGSAGTIAAGDYLRTIHPDIRIVATEALQCPTLYACGFGDHRIEGIGDKHIPWIHNVRNTDMIAAIDDEQCMALMRLFNEPAGREFLTQEGVPTETVNQLGDCGISSICNLVAAIKTAKYYDMNERDVIFLPLTDSMEMYYSRMQELSEAARVEPSSAAHPADSRSREPVLNSNPATGHMALGTRHFPGTPLAGPYSESLASRHFARYLEAIQPDHVRELTYNDRKTLHNFKYFTWVEQQGRTSDELRQLWDRDFWTEQFGQLDEWDRAIGEFNRGIPDKP